ncbi:MAG: serine/threonine protein kinase, partial [Planctomycetes bacterium]|nr:serine/threonine protein kinase [Planctomycetota bacterium]
MSAYGSQEERYIARLVSYDAALEGGTCGAQDETQAEELDPALHARLRRAQQCLNLLEEVWPRGGGTRTAATTPSLGADESLSAEASPDCPIALGRFQIHRELGHGGCGIVYLAFDPVLQREVALKVPRPESLIDPHLRRRFLREAQAAAALDHPNILPVYEAQEIGAVCYITSAYCRGPTLAAWLKEHPLPVPPRIAALIVVALADALHHSHRRGILHRDLKPSNVLLEPNRADAGVGATPGDELAFIPKLTDFGLAKLLGTKADETRSGTVLGTPMYMAPEQA